MPQYELTTSMRNVSGSLLIGTSAGGLWLPPEIVIVTTYNSWLNDGLRETRVIGNADGKRTLIGTHASLYTLREQHQAVVDVYTNLGYEMIKQPNDRSDDESRGAELDKKLREMFREDPNLERLL